MWVPAEIKDPVWQHAPTRKSVACFGAVSLRSGKFVRAMCGVFNAETFEAFLKKLLRHRARGQRMVVVLDNAKYHAQPIFRHPRRSARRRQRLLRPMAHAQFSVAATMLHYLRRCV